VLRGTKSFLFAVVINSVGIGLAMLAMVKVLEALQVFDQLATIVPGLAGADDNAKLWTVVLVTIFVLIYAGLAGLWGVVVTDFFQFFLGLFGAIVVAVIAVSSVGGLGEMVRNVEGLTDFEMITFTPFDFEGGLLIDVVRRRYHLLDLLRLRVHSMVGIPAVGWRR
jgi:solute:Na+ symporter, SSS family